jgi:hypothetical protein
MHMARRSVYAWRAAGPIVLYVMRVLPRRRPAAPPVATARGDTPLSAAARAAYAALDRRPAPLDGAAPVEVCVGDRLAAVLVGHACVAKAAWFTDVGYLCDTHYVAWIKEAGSSCVFGFAEARDGAWRTFGVDADGRATWPHSVEQVLDAQRRRTAGADQATG